MEKLVIARQESKVTIRRQPCQIVYCVERVCSHNSENILKMASIEAAQQQILSQMETKSSMSFEIPPDIYNDILYLQKSLRHHIQVHQVNILSRH